MQNELAWYYRLALSYLYCVSTVIITLHAWNNRSHFYPFNAIICHVLLPLLWLHIGAQVPFPEKKIRLSYPKTSCYRENTRICCISPGISILHFDKRADSYEILSPALLWRITSILLDSRVTLHLKTWGLSVKTLSSSPRTATVSFVHANRCVLVIFSCPSNIPRCSQ